MTDTRSIIVAVFGLAQREVRVLQTICFISQTRLRTYELMPTDGRIDPDMAILDGNDEQAVAEWKQFSSNRPMLPLVVIGDNIELDRPGIKIERPLLATRLLSIFDQIDLSNEDPAFATANNDVIPKDTGPAIGQDSIPAPQCNSNLSALVVDDNLMIRVQMQKELSQYVGNVDLAETGEQALELMGKHHYDIIFLDVILPGMDGYQICKTVKRDKENKNIPVVMLTGKSSPFDQIRGKLAGCNDYLIKPVDLLEFKYVVEQHLTKKA